MQISGMEADFDKTKLLFQRVTAARIKPDNGPAVPIDLADTTKCYKVVTTIYLAGLFGLVKDVSGGLVIGRGQGKGLHHGDHQHRHAHRGLQPGHRRRWTS